MDSDLRGVASYLLWVAALFAAFLAAYILKRHFVPGSIVFYEGLAVAAWVAAAYAVLRLVAALPARRQRSVAASRQLATAVPILCTYVLLAYGFVITIPALLDRSISIFIIGAVAQQQADGISAEELSGKLVDQYVQGTAMARKRLDEQLSSGNMEESNGRYRLTSRGRLVYRTNVLLSDLLNIDKRFVIPR